MKRLLLPLLLLAWLVTPNGGLVNLDKVCRVDMNKNILTFIFCQGEKWGSITTHSVAYKSPEDALTQILNTK